MTKRIDHVAAAESDIVSADDALESGADDVASAIAAVAQVHATLALVEQQRMANLVALLGNAARMVAENTASPAEYIELFKTLDPAVREGLGL